MLCLDLHVCMLCVVSQILAKAFRLDLSWVGFGFGLDQVVELGLGCVGDYVWPVPSHPHSLICSLSHSLLPSSLFPKPKPNTIHSYLQALISPLDWRLFRVGLDVEDLLAPGYAWTPSLRRSAKV